MNEALLSDVYIQAIQPLMKGKFTGPEIKLAATMVPAETNPDEFAAYMAYCAGLDLSPLTGEVHLERKKVKKDSNDFKMTYVVHIDAYRRAAAVQDKLDGIDQVAGMDPDSGYYVDTILDIKGMKNPVKSRAYYAEYKVNGSFMWDKKFMMTAKCFDPETEVLTDAGFLKFQDIRNERIMQVSDQGVEPTSSKPFSQDYDGLMVSINKTDLAFCVTPNHDMVTTTGKVEAAEMYAVARSRAVHSIPRHVQSIRQDDPNFSDLQLKLAGVYLADGWQSSGTSFKVAVSRNRKVSYLDSLNAHTSISTVNCAGNIAEGSTRVITTKKNKTAYLYPMSLVSGFIGEDKRIETQAILNLSKRQARILLDSWQFFDGNVTPSGTKRIFTSREHHAKAIELLGVMAGYAVSSPVVRFVDIATKPNYCYILSDQDAFPVMRYHREYRNLEIKPKESNIGLTLTENKAGKVWCVTVPSGTIVVRRGAFSMLCGNCSEALAYRKAGILVGSISEEEADRDRAEWGNNTPPTDDFKVAEKQPETKPAATTQAAPADAAKTEPQPTQTVTTAVDASPATNQAQPEPEKKQEAAPRPKLTERINNLATVLEFDDKSVLEPLIVKFQMGFFDKSTAEEVAALRSKEYVPQHHAYIDKIEEFIKTYGTKFVKAYLTDQPIVLGRFAGGRMDTLPGLPGFKPEARESNITMQALKQAFSKYDLDEAILMNILNLCTNRGYNLPELQNWAKTNRITPKDPLLFNLCAVLSREVDNLDPFLAKVRKGGSVSAWGSLLQKELGKPIGEADAVELEQAIAKLPDTLPAEEPEDDQAGF